MRAESHPRWLPENGECHACSSAAILDYGAPATVLLGLRVRHRSARKLKAAVRNVKAGPLLQKQEKQINKSSLRPSGTFSSYNSFGRHESADICAIAVRICAGIYSATIKTEAGKAPWSFAP